VVAPSSKTDDDVGSEGEAAEGEGEAAEGEGEALDDTSLFVRLAGLWAGPVDSQTSLGDFVLMSMDHRVSDGVLFARGDFDADNAIRWWLWLDDTGRLRFENGGYFAGFFRSDGCVLDSVVDDTWRFCALDGGCDHIDARFAFSASDRLRLSIVVDGAPHATWDAEQVETRAAAVPAATDGSAPALPSVVVNATFSEVPEGASLWLILTAGRCGLTFDCNVSRSFRQTLAAGATSTSFVVNEVHPGAYFGVVVVDTNGNFSTSPFPDGGDRVSVPDRPVTIDAVDGATLSFAATIAPP
jgi:hypothetical protein